MRVRKHWQLLPHSEERIRFLAQSANISAVVAQLLINRGITDAEAARRFLEPAMAALHPPRRLPNMERAVQCLLATVQAGQRIRIFGDYDTDGVTGVAILVKLIEHLGGRVDYHIPHRIDDGYGLNGDAVRKAWRDGVGLLITVDCGITAIDAAREAQQLGLPLIVTDHHEPQAELPTATAIVHPALPGGNYPFAGLSGSGVAFKLAWGVAQQVSGGGERVTPELRQLLLELMGLAALGLVADVVPLLDENRILVKHGLKRLIHQPPLGVKALMEVAQIQDQLLAEDVSYKLAPRINAPGRLGCAQSVVELLTTRSPIKARELAEWLNKLNSDRQTLERRITTQAREMIASHGYDADPALVLGSPEWHQGVVGVVAGRLAEQTGKPTILLSLRGEDAISTGSGRAPDWCPLHEALTACADYLETHGGHAAAAGLSLRPSRLEAFRAAFVDYVRRLAPNGVPPPRLMLDAEVPLTALTFNLLNEIDKLEPYGAGNTKPRFLATELRLEGQPRRIGKDERHLSFRVKQYDAVIRAVAFGMGDRFDELMSDSTYSVVFTPKLNEFRGSRSVEMEVIDFRAEE